RHRPAGGCRHASARGPAGSGRAAAARAARPRADRGSRAEAPGGVARAGRAGRASRARAAHLARGARGAGRAGSGTRLADRGAGVRRAADGAPRRAGGARAPGAPRPGVPLGAARGCGTARARGGGADPRRLRRRRLHQRGASRAPLPHRRRRRPSACGARANRRRLDRPGVLGGARGARRAPPAGADAAQDGPAGGARRRARTCPGPAFLSGARGHCASRCRRVTVASVAAPPFLAACRREATAYTPVWLMRQAGRYQPEYRAIREKLGFLELCKPPDAAAEVTVNAVRQLGVDAAILFADILLVLEPMGVGLEFAAGDGPVIHRPLRTAADVDGLREFEPEALAFVYETVRRARAALRPEVPLIGFAGAPFTLASYLIEGGRSDDWATTKGFLFSDPGAWDALLAALARAVTAYLSGQIGAGGQAVQLFDSGVGCLAPAASRAHVLPHVQALIRGIRPGVPVIHFGTGTAGLLECLRAAGGDVIGIDWRVDLDAAWARIGHDVAVQGNLDPIALLGPIPEIRRRAAAILGQAAGRPGHVSNLGHGVLPSTPVDHARALVDAVHELSAR